MLVMTPGIIFDRSTIETLQTGDTSWSGLVNLKRIAIPRNRYDMENHLELDKF